MKRYERKFYAFDNGLTRVKNFEEKAALLKELGYDGIGWRVGNKPTQIIEALDKHNLRMFSIYVGGIVDAENPTYDKRLVNEIKLLKKHNTAIWLFLRKGKSPNDDAAVEIVSEVASLAEQAGLKVVLYPHAGFYVETIEDELRILERVNKSNIRLSFNLCHFLKTHNEKNLEAALQKIAPYLALVSINGADSGNTQLMNWDRLIQPLGEGSFNVSRVLKLLDKIGYTGPVCLQCYGIKGDDRENLKKSIIAWKKMIKNK